MSLDQLLALNDLICRRIDELQAHQEMEVLSRLTLGQAVSFESREGRCSVASSRSTARPSSCSRKIADSGRSRWR